MQEQFTRIAESFELGRKTFNVENDWEFLSFTKQSQEACKLYGRFKKRKYIFDINFQDDDFCNGFPHSFYFWRKHENNHEGFLLEMKS